MSDGKVETRKAIGCFSLLLFAGGCGIASGQPVTGALVGFGVWIVVGFIADSSLEEGGVLFDFPDKTNPLLVPLYFVLAFIDGLLVLIIGWGFVLLAIGSVVGGVALVIYLISKGY